MDFKSRVPGHVSHASIQRREELVADEPEHSPSELKLANSLSIIGNLVHANRCNSPDYNSEPGMTTLLENPAPLQNNYLPRQVVNREDIQAELEAALSDITEGYGRNLHLHGPRGTGKTHLTHLILDDLPSQVNTCYIPCTRYDTQYKALKHLAEQVSQEEISEGHHTAEIQRRIEDRTQTLPTVVVLDEVDFTLLNDGDDLLYYLSRIKTGENISLITISANKHDLGVQLEERTFSSLHPQRIRFDPYTNEEIYRILVERARKALVEQSIHREALISIASTVNNVSYGLQWLRTAAETTDGIITEHHIKEVETQAYQNYADSLLTEFSEHHHLLYQAIQELTREQGDSVIRTGQIYSRYQDLCDSYNEGTLSNRRLSDYLKHLELLNLVEADYHYGGSKGKTREIELRSLPERAP